MYKLIELYLDYVNNFISVGAFADYYLLELEDAETLILMGKKYHENSRP